MGEAIERAKRQYSADVTVGDKFGPSYITHGYRVRSPSRWSTSNLSDIGESDQEGSGMTKQADGPPTNRVPQGRGCVVGKMERPKEAIDSLRRIKYETSECAWRNAHAISAYVLSEEKNTYKRKRRFRTTSPDGWRIRTEKLYTGLHGNAKQG